MSATDTQCLALPVGATCYWKDMWQQLNSMRSQFQLCDVILCTGDDGFYGAHSPVLAASSNVFYDFFLNKSSTDSVLNLIDDTQNKKILIKGINRQVLHVVLDFIYGVTPLTFVEFEKLKVGADLLKIHSAYNYCGEKFYQNGYPRPTDYINYSDTVPPYSCPQRKRKVCPVTNTSGESCPISDIVNLAIDNDANLRNSFQIDNDSSSPTTTLSVVTPPSEPHPPIDIKHSIASMTFDDLETPMECPHLKKKAASNNWTTKLEQDTEQSLTSISQINPMNSVHSIPSTNPMAPDIPLTSINHMSSMNLISSISSINSVTSMNSMTSATSTNSMNSATSMNSMTSVIVSREKLYDDESPKCVTPIADISRDESLPPPLIEQNSALFGPVFPPIQSEPRAMSASFCPMQTDSTDTNYGHRMTTDSPVTATSTDQCGTTSPVSLYNSKELMKYENIQYNSLPSTSIKKINKFQNGDLNYGVLQSPSIEKMSNNDLYLSEIQLRSHLKYNLNQNKTSVDGTCPDCSLNFSSIHKLNTHLLKVHNRGKLFKCDICIFKSPRKKDVQAHMLSQHDKAAPGIKVFTCSKCQYKCIDRNRYEEHEAKHSGIAKFDCELCGKSYTTRRGMRTHLKYHNPERPFKCTICIAKFKVRSKLKDHIKLLHTHVGEKNFKCSYCKHATALRGNCTQHQKKHHPDLPPNIIDLSSSCKTKRYDYSDINGAGIATSEDVGAANVRRDVTLDP